MRALPRVRHGSASKRRDEARDRDRRKGDYDSAMFAVRQAVTDLEIARRRTEPAAGLRAVHGRIDDALARAAAAAADVHAGLFQAAGGVHHAEVDRVVALWKRRLNTALTLRSQHQLAQADDKATLSLAGARAHTRAAYGPHQAGLDFDNEPDGNEPDGNDRDGNDPEGAAGHSSTALDLDAWVNLAPTRSAK